MNTVKEKMLQRKLKIDMNKPMGATQQQLDDNNIEWVLCGNYGHVDVQNPKWALRCSGEYEWAKERTMLLQQIANLKRELYYLDPSSMPGLGR